MRKVIVLFLLACIIGCKSDSKTTPKKESWAKTHLKKKSQEKDALFQASIDSMVNDQVLLKEKLKHADTLTADKLYITYTDAYYKHVYYIETLQADLIENYYDWVKYDDKGTTHMPSFVKDITKELDKAGLEIWDEGENITVLRAKAHYFEDVFGRYSSNGLRAFLHQDAIDCEVLWLNDARVGITWQELGEKLAAWEEIVKKYPQGVFIKDATGFTQYYRQLFLSGTDNSPVIDSSTEQVDITIKQAFKNFIQKYPDSPTTPLIKEVLHFKGGNVELEKMIARKLGLTYTAI